MFLYLILGVLVTLISLHILTRYEHAGRFINTIPNAYPTLLIIGILLFGRKNKLSSWNMFRELHKKYYPIVKLWSLNFSTVLIWDPDDVKIVLNFVDEKAAKKRRLLSPTYYTDIFKKCIEVTNYQAKEFIQKMSENNNDGVKNLSALSSKLMLTIVTEISMGVEPESFTERSGFYEDLLKRIFETVHHRSFNPLISNWVFNFMALSREQNALRDEVSGLMVKLIDERRTYHESTEYTIVESEDKNESAGGRKNFAALDLLLSLEKKSLIDESGILEEIITFAVAAHYTAKTSIIFTLLLLAENLESQTVARKEAIEVIDRCGGVLTVDSLKELEYIERCILEAMRIFPPGHMILRSITKDLPLKNHVISAGTDLMVMIFDLHRDPRWWTDPLKYDPDRFLPEKMKSQYSYTYVPLSAGPRNCLGQKLAIMTVKTLVAYMLYNYKLEPVTKSDEVKFKLSIILAPSEPIYIRTFKL